MLGQFWRWYERYFVVHLQISTALFLLQLVHLLWLTTNVVVPQLAGAAPVLAPPSLLIALVDYIEIPAIVGLSIVYLRDVSNGRATPKTWLNLAFLNSQWLHLFWITDEVVVASLTGTVTLALPRWLAWVAITIDYLELPVMVDTVLLLFKTRTKNNK